MLEVGDALPLVDDPVTIGSALVGWIGDLSLPFETTKPPTCQVTDIVENTAQFFSGFGSYYGDEIKVAAYGIQGLYLRYGA